ncbi:hypothetical protein WISP_143639 [Willisornis vidua]|uniref:Uncharacterized protein n=1 Tax=Willisornis vidua TaxID=1566151 RepID=A0ABQ9CNW5_9PASS|nr:hypothetical protein WISP_143639 [Willisornis vidua]
MVEKNLGVHIDEKLDMTRHCTLIVLKANPILGCMKSSMTTRSREMILPLYFLPLRPHLECCVQLCDPQCKKDLDLLVQSIIHGHYACGS